MEKVNVNLFYILLEETPSACPRKQADINQHHFFSMKNVVPFFQITTGAKPRVAIFLSGSGSNAERILAKCRDSGQNAPLEVVALVTDAPEKSRARELGQMYDLPVVENDIRAFYRKQGLSRITIRTPEGQQARNAWTDALRTALAPYAVDFGVLAGFVPLTNITQDFPCLNVHPGDLTYLKEGHRYLVGLHTIPVERAILEDLCTMRSSVIVAQPYTGSGSEMDSGPILGISEAVEIDLQGTPPDELQACLERRPEKRPRGGYQDCLEAIAQRNLEKLKHEGDWVVFPQVVFDFARQRFGLDQDNALYYRMNHTWQPIQTIVYGKQQREVLFRSTEHS